MDLSKPIFYLKLAFNRLEIEKSTSYCWQDKEEKKDLNETSLSNKTC